MITNPHNLAATLLELAETNRPSMCSWVSARLRDIADNLAEPVDHDDDWQLPKSSETAGETAERTR